MTETPESINDRVGREVRGWIARRSLTQADAAILIGVSQQGISRRLSGTTPFALDELETLATAFGIRLAVLLGEPPTVTELRNNAPIPDAPGHRLTRNRRGGKTSAYKSHTCRKVRNLPVTSSYLRRHPHATGEAAHTRRAA